MNLLGVACLLRLGIDVAGSTRNDRTTSQQLVLLDSFDSRPPPIRSQPDTSNHIFASFVGLLQQWPNTFASSGHSIIAGVIPRSTTLYHGLSGGDTLPQGFEWLAFDPEMSYSVHAWSKAGQLELLTYVTQRPLRVIYLDGQSASLGKAYMDSQGVLINGTVEENMHWEGAREGEYKRGIGLCKLGRQLGFEGIVRMNTGFELMWCDFQQGIHLISRTNITDPFAEPCSAHEPKSLEKNPGPAHSPFYSISAWEVARIGAQNYRAPGEVRVVLDPSTFISFYDRIKSLAEKREIDGTDRSPRSKHRLYGISRFDAQKILDRLTRVLEQKKAIGWESDHERLSWQSVGLSIIKKYSDRLVELAFRLKQNNSDAMATALDVRWMTYAMLMPYTDFTDFSSTNESWLKPTVEKCTTAFTSGTYNNHEPTESIQVIIGAIEGTLAVLCTTLSGIFAETIKMNLPSKPVGVQTSELKIQMRQKIEKWRIKIDQLMQWLGWSTWQDCDPKCEANEICLTPMWPVTGRFYPHGPPHNFPICHRPLKASN